MDFIERIFHIAPDGGTGMLELSFVIVFVIAPIVATMVLRRRRGQGQQERFRHDRDA
jgi:archaellum biogenesis protein FlaJ (TadC family)